tara:strand:- start:161 stop:331 length:171 start_codon:yes stop_codon:yes gene_type:complete
MRISDMIDRLTEAQDLHGDLHVEDESGHEVFGISVVMEGDEAVAVCVGDAQGGESC